MVEHHVDAKIVSKYIYILQLYARIVDITEYDQKSKIYENQNKKN